MIKHFACERDFCLHEKMKIECFEIQCFELLESLSSVRNNENKTKNESLLNHKCIIFFYLFSNI